MADARKPLTRQEAKRIWIHAQRLDTASPFGAAQAGATTRAIEHLGYVQIDTINVIERCHHHILFNRIPGYRREHLGDAQTKQKSVFEYWTHALSYVPSRDFRFFMSQMNAYRRDPSRWFYKAPPAEIRRVLKTIEKEGAITIRDIDDEVLVEKNHAWASRKPSKKALEVAFYGGQVAISERIGMLKRYELTARHFGWNENPNAKPKPATEAERFEYRLDRALRSQGLVSLDSVSYLEPSAKPKFLKLIERRARKGELIEVAIEGVSEKFRYWSLPEIAMGAEPTLTHVLSPFDPLVIQRKRLARFFDYEHRFEAYLPKEKRLYGYFALPVLMDDEIVALLDLKTDRQNEKLLVQKWTWLKKFKSKERKRRIEEALGRFETFQLLREPERG